MLDSIDVGLSAAALELRVGEIRAQRDREIASGLFENVQGVDNAKKRKKRAGHHPVLDEQATLQESFLKAEHVRMAANALSHAALTCFRLRGPFTEYSLLSGNNVNVFPGFRNFGSTCWLNATLQCMLHTVPIRRHLLRESDSISEVDVALKRISKYYWALSSRLRHSVLAPVDLLTALVLERPQLGGALQQDVGDVLLLFRLGEVAGIAEFQEQYSHVCLEGVTFVNLEVDDLQKNSMSLHELLDCTLPEWEMLATPPSFLVIVYPNVFEVPEGGFRYSELALTDVDVPLRMGVSRPGPYSLRAYVQHRHQGQPASTSRSGGHYVAHFKNANVWYTADDTTTLLRREVPHMLPAVAFFELISDPSAVDWPLCDPGALSREPAWIQSALEILSALHMDGEWRLGLSEDEQVTVAQVASAKDAGGVLSEVVRDDIYKLLAGGARGSASGVFDLPSSESEAMSDEGDLADLSVSSSSQHPATAAPASQTISGSRSTNDKTLPGQLCLDRFFSVPAHPCKRTLPLQLGSTSGGQPEDRAGQQQTQAGRSRSRLGRSQGRDERKQHRAGQQQDRAGRQQDQAERARAGRQQDQAERDRAGRQQDQAERDRAERQQDQAERDRAERQQDRAGRQQDRSGHQQLDTVQRLDPVSMYEDIRSHPTLASCREKLREFPSASAESLPPVFCMLCYSNFCRVEDLRQHLSCVLGGLQRYRHVVLHLLSLRPFVLAPTFSRAIVSNFLSFTPGAHWIGKVSALRCAQL